MKAKALEKYKELKSERPNLDKEMVDKFISEMPEEAIMLFDNMMYGNHIANEELYNCAVSYLKWTDDKGSGAKWAEEDILKLSGINFDDKDYYPLDYCYVVNMLYSDYCDIFTEPSYYLRMARNYLEDNDYMGNASERAYINAKKRIEYFS